MKSRRRRDRMYLELEPLEGRVALSHMGAAVEDGPRRHRGGHAEVHTPRGGVDDPANHDVNDAGHGMGGAGEAVQRHRGGGDAEAHGHGHGADDPIGHK